MMESRNTIDISTGSTSLKRIPKKSVILELSVPDSGKIRIDGMEIVGRPENRIKMKRRKMIKQPAQSTKLRRESLL
jgi:RNase P/RNase MRP subunit p29